MAVHAKRYYTPEEYLALERAAEYKSEYLDGEIFAMSEAGEISAMAGAGEDHNTLAVNIVWLLRSQFEGRPCRVYGSDMRVRVAPDALCTYPDVIVVQGPREFADNHCDTLLNPTVIFEVLSPSTEAYDRGKKFAQYWRLESLTDYVLVAQDQVEVEHFTRQGNSWFVTAARTLDETLHLASIDATLPLTAIYTNVELPASDATEPPV